jgi:uncharacterized protein with HEPN domain
MSTRGWTEHNVDVQILWDTVQDDLPTLKAALKQVVSDIPNNAP